jgi:hypothetical protein
MGDRLAMESVTGLRGIRSEPLAVDPRVRLRATRQRVVAVLAPVLRQAVLFHRQCAEYEAAGASAL